MQHKGIVYILFSSLSYAVVNFSVKYLDHIPTHEIVFFRSLISLVMSVYMIRYLGIPLWGNNKKWLIIRGLTGAAALFLFFSTIKTMPLAVATTLQFLSPIFTVILATQLLGERVRPVQWLFFLSAFAGVLLIQGFETGVSKTDLAIGVTGAIVSGIAYNAVMKCRHTDHPITVVLYFPMIAAPITGIACLSVEWVPPVGWDWLVLLVMGVATQLAQLYMTKALHTGDSSTIMPFNYLGVVYALAIGYFAFNELPTYMSIIGIGVIIASVIANTLIGRARKPTMEAVKP